MPINNRISLSVIRTNLEAWGFPLTDAQFNSLSIKQLKTIHRKAYKARNLSNDVWAIVEEVVMDATERE